MRLADGHDDRPGHAALPGGAERRADDAADRLVDHRVGHDDHVVLGPAEGLDALAGLRRALVDDLGDRGRADERDGVDARVVEDALDDLAAAVDEVDHAGRQAERVELLEGDLLGQRDLLGGLEDERVPAGDREREEPEGHHRREVEGDDRRAIVLTSRQAGTASSSETSATGTSHQLS